MFKAISIVTLVVVALGATACGQIRVPDALPQLPQLPTGLSPNSAPNPTTNNSPETSQQTTPSSTVPGSEPQAGQKLGRGAQGIAALLQVFHQLGWEAGVVAKVSSDQIALRTVKNGPDKIAVGTSTIIIVPGKSGATISDIHVGDRIIADIPKNQTTAALVMSVPKDYTKDNLLLGQVRSNSNGSVTLKTRGGPDTLTTNVATQVIQVQRQGVALGAVSDLQSGVLVVAIGESSSDEFVGQAVFALPNGVLELGKRLGGGRKNPPQPPPAKPDN